MIVADVNAVALFACGLGVLVGLAGFGLFALGLPWSGTSTNGVALVFGAFVVLAGMGLFGLGLLMWAVGVGSAGPVDAAVQRGELAIVDEQCALSDGGVALATGQLVNATDQDLDVVVTYAFTLADGSSVDGIPERYLVPAGSSQPLALIADDVGGAPGPLRCHGELDDAVGP